MNLNTICNDLWFIIIQSSLVQPYPHFDRLSQKVVRKIFAQYIYWPDQLIDSLGRINMGNDKLVQYVKIISKYLDASK